jgi:hypothetical protein
VIPERVFALPGTTAVQETTFVADTVAQQVNRRVPDLGLALSWTHRAFGLDAAAHLALAGELQRADPLARVHVTYGLGPRISAVAGVVSRSAIPSRGVPARQFATIGIRIRGGGVVGAATGASSRPSASEFRAANEGDDQVAFAVRAVGATRVEVAGDFTHWAPLDLQRAPDGWWRARVRLARGLHQVSIRVDGGRWTAPPGLSPVQDDFGATVGLLVMQ